MKAFTHVLLFILFMMSVCIEAKETSTGVDKKAYIELVTQRYAPQTKGLIPYFDSSELVEKIPNSDLAVVMLPYGTSSNENDTSFSLVLAVVDVKHKSIVQSYFHKDIAQSDAIYVSDIILDTKKFHDISKHTTFAVTIQHLGSSRPNPYANYNLYMYSLKDGKLSLILDTFEVMNSGGENDAAGIGYEISTVLTYKLHKKNKEYDTLIFDSLSKRVDFDYSDNKSEENISGVVRKEIQLLYIDGKYENIDLKHLEAEVKGGDARSKNFYVELLNNMPITKKNVRIYNDIAYYLEQNNYNEEAIMLLDAIVRKVRDRTVAYINLGDAYWKSGKRYKAYTAYSNYMKQMSVKHRSNRVPNRVKQRVKVQKKVLTKLLLGTWRDEKDNFTITIYIKHRRLHYTIQTPKRKLTGELKITVEDAVYIDFSNVRWAEWRGSLTDEEYADVGKPQKKEELPVGVEALFDWENEEFVIQNDGNAMNYYVKFRESNSKFMEFRRRKK